MDQRARPPLRTGSQTCGRAPKRVAAAIPLRVQSQPHRLQNQATMYAILLLARSQPDRDQDAEAARPILLRAAMNPSAASRSHEPARRFAQPSRLGRIPLRVRGAMRASRRWSASSPYPTLCAGRRLHFASRCFSRARKVCQRRIGRHRSVNRPLRWRCARMTMTLDDLKLTSPRALGGVTI